MNVYDIAIYLGLMSSRVVVEHRVLVLRSAERELNAVVAGGEEVLARRVRDVAAQAEAHDRDGHGHHLLPQGHHVPLLLHQEHDRQNDGVHGDAGRAHEVGQVGEVVFQDHGRDHQQDDDRDPQDDVLDSVHAAVLGRFRLGVAQMDVFVVGNGDVGALRELRLLQMLGDVVGRGGVGILLRAEKFQSQPAQLSEAEFK
jgi:hypothetical protein